MGQKPTKQTFSTHTVCGKGTFTILESYPWISLSVDTIKIAPVDNSEQGEYTLTLSMLLDEKPTAPAFLTTFDVKIYPEINFPPYFVERLPAIFRINKTQDPKPWSYVLPPSLDRNFADTVTL